MAEQSDFGGATTDTKETMLSSRNDNDSNHDNESYVGSSSSKTNRVKKAKTNLTHKTKKDKHHRNTPSEYTQHIAEEDEQKESTKRRHRRRKPTKAKQYLSSANQTSTPSPNSPNSASPASSSHRRIQKKDGNNVSLLKILDATPQTLKDITPGSEDPRCAELSKSIYEKIYFPGNWNRGGYNIINEDYHEKLKNQAMGYATVSVWGDDILFQRTYQRKKTNREHLSHYSPLLFENYSYPLPTQRLKRLLNPYKELPLRNDLTEELKKALTEETIERLTQLELKYYKRLKNRAALLRGLYDDITPYQTNSILDKDIHSQKRAFWKRQQYELNEQNVGVVSENNVPPWIVKGN